MFRFTESFNTSRLCRKVLLSKKFNVSLLGNYYDIQVDQIWQERSKVEQELKDLELEIQLELKLDLELQLDVKLQPGFM